MDKKNNERIKILLDDAMHIYCDNKATISIVQSSPSW